jgi:hypothetical protein
MIKRFLFLDIDGVLNTNRSLFSKYAEHYNIPYDVSDFAEPYWNSVDGVNPNLLDKILEVRKSEKYTLPKVFMYDYPFDKICIEYFNKIVEDNECEIVFISSWRKGRDLEELQQLCNDEGIKCKVIGKTGSDETRALEIYEWIIGYQKKYNTKIESICIIDDEHAFDIDYMFNDFTVKDITARRNGLRIKHIQESNDIFNKPFDINKIEKK